MAKFVIFHKEYRFAFDYDLRTDDDVTILSSIYAKSSRSACKNSVASVRINSKIDARYLKNYFIAERNCFYLTAMNGTRLGESPECETDEQRLEIMAKVKALAADAELIDLTL